LHSLPGGRFAPPPPVSRIAVGGIAFLVTGVFCFAWAGVTTLKALTTKEKTVSIVGTMLRQPVTDRLTEEVKRHPDAKTYSVAADLVVFDVDRAAAADINIGRVLADRRAEELWLRGYPRDPGLERTTTEGFPRSLVTLFSEHRHKQMDPAGLAALFGVAAGMLVCAFMATGAARFGLPGAAALLGYMIFQYHVRLLNFWFDKNGTNGLHYKTQVHFAVFDPQRKLLFVAIALLAAGLVYSALLGGTKAVAQERKRKRTGGAPAPVAAASIAAPPVAAPPVAAPPAPVAPPPVAPAPASPPVEWAQPPPPPAPEQPPAHWAQPPPPPDYAQPPPPSQG
jgi:hypothetical protein